MNEKLYTSLSVSYLPCFLNVLAFILQQDLPLTGIPKALAFGLVTCNYVHRNSFIKRVQILVRDKGLSCVSSMVKQGIFTLLDSFKRPTEEGLAWSYPTIRCSKDIGQAAFKAVASLFKAAKGDSLLPKIAMEFILFANHPFITSSMGSDAWV